VDNAVSAMFANLASTMAIEFKRMQITNDLEIYRGANNQEMLRVKAASKPLCGSTNCAGTTALLAFQNTSSTAKKYIFNNGTQLDPWRFSARLVAGYRAQKTCEQRWINGDASACVAELHYYELTDSTPIAPVCGISGLNLLTFKASKADASGNKLSPEQRLTDAAKLQKRYLWTDQDQNLPVNDNEFMKFEVSADGLYIKHDPGDGGYPTPGTPGSCPTSRLKFGYASPSLTGTCCSLNGGTNMWYQPYNIAADGSGYWQCVNKP
jgi:hypothetical protein